MTVFRSCVTAAHVTKAIPTKSSAMQEASGPPYRVVSLGLKPRFRGQSPRVKSSFKFQGRCFAFCYLFRPPSCFLKSRREAIRVVRVVVAVAAVGIDEPEIVRVRRIDGAEPPIAGGAVRTCPKEITLSRPLPPCGGSRSTVSCRSPKPPGAGRAHCLPASSTFGTSFHTPPCPQRSCFPRQPARSKK